MKKACPECSKSLGLVTVLGLRAGQRVPPTPCDRCGVLLTNAWYADLLPLAVFLPLFWAAFSDYATRGSVAVLSIVGSICLALVLRYVLASPLRYEGRKGRCPYCARADAVHDWTGDAMCIDCDLALRRDPVHRGKKTA